MKSKPAFFKARLHDPDFAHVGGQLAAARHVANAALKHLVDGVLQRRQRGLALPQAPLPAGFDVLPQHTGEQKARRNGFAFLHAAVGVGQGGQHKGRVAALHHHVQQRVDAFGQAQLLELLDGGNGVPRLQEFEHLVEHAALRHVGQ